MGITLAGERIVLRPVETVDLAHGYRWEQDKEMQHWAQGDRAPDNLTYEEYVARYAPTAYSTPDTAQHFTIVARPERMIGFTSYFHLNRTVGAAEIGIGIGEKAYWGKGYGREAIALLLGHLINDLGVQRVQLDTWSGNVRAIRAYEAVGFQVEGRLRRAQFIDSAYYDTIVMGILREEFLARGEQREREHR